MDDKKIKIDEELIEDKNENREQKVSDKKKLNPFEILNRVNKKYLIFGAIGLVLIFLVIFKISSKKNASIQNSATTSQIDENSYNQSRIMRVDLNKIKSIDFELGSSDVRIQRSNTNPYIEYTELFRGDDHSYKLDVSFDEGVLKLKSKVTGKQLYMKDKIPIVRIFLPSEGGIEEIKGTISSGDVKIDDLEVKNFDLRIRSGNISLNNGFFQGSIKNEAGSITLNKSEISNTKLSTVSGDIIVKESKLGNRLDFATSTGDILVDAKDTIDNYNINAYLEVGNFVLGNISYRNIKDGYLSDNGAKNNIDLRTKIGDIVFNRGEGSTIENEEYLTNDSRVKDDDENALERNVKITEKENKKRKKKKRRKDLEENQDSEKDKDSEKNQDQDLEENSQEEENN